MNKNKKIIVYLLPTLFAFFVMGLVDVVGIATSYVKDAFGLSEKISGFLPSMVFIWFLIFSIPFAGIMNKIGRKNTVILSMVVTLFGMLLPVFSMPNLNFVICCISFALLGIGNAIIQVSLNPLLSNIVSGNSLTSAVTAGQVIKAISSFAGPFIAIFAVNILGNWSYLFPIFGGITLLSILWLLFVPMPNEKNSETNNFSSISIGSSIKKAFKLLKNKTILLFFFGILVVVGLDVGINMLAPKILSFKLCLPATNFGYANSIYFACRTIGAFIGAALLIKFNALKYFKIHTFIGLIALLGLIFVSDKITILCCIGLAGYGFSSIFSIIFSLAMQALPEKSNEISGLMVTGITGGAIFPPIMTWTSGSMHDNQIGAIAVLIIISLFLIYLSFRIKINKIQNDNN